MIINFRSNYDSFPHEWGNGSGMVNMYCDNKVFYLENEDLDQKDALAILAEPRSIIPGTYQWVAENYSRFKYIFTFDSELLKLPNAKLLIYGQITAEFPDDEKTKNISMVASNKDFCDGHITRQNVARLLSGSIDTYGKFKGDEYCKDSDYLSGYRFNVAMENFSDGYYFTEKICNCLASKIVPIYWGCPHIDEFFDMDGIIYCKTPTQVVNRVLDILQDPEGEYEIRKKAIEHNFREVQKYRSYSKLFLETYGDILEDIGK